MGRQRFFGMRDMIRLHGDRLNLVAGRCQNAYRSRSEDERAVHDAAAASAVEEHDVFAPQDDVDFLADLVGNAAEDDAGEKEVADGTISVRERATDQTHSDTTEAFIARILEEIRNYSR